MTRGGSWRRKPVGLFFAGSPSCSFFCTAAVIFASSVNMTRFLAGRAGSRSPRGSGQPTGARTFNGNLSRLALASIASRARLFGETGASGHSSAAPGVLSGGGGEVCSVPGSRGICAGGGGIAGGGCCAAGTGGARPKRSACAAPASGCCPVAHGVPGIVSSLVPLKRWRTLQRFQGWLPRPEHEEVSDSAAEAVVVEQIDSASEMHDSGSVVSSSFRAIVTM